MKFSTVLGHILLVQQAAAFYFYHEGSERRCFLKELTQGSVFTGTYNVQLYDDDVKAYRPPQGSDLQVVIDVEETFDGDQRIVHQKSAASGVFTFNTEESGEHRICIQPQGSGGWLSKSRAKITLDMSVGSDSALDSKKRSTIESLHGKVDLLGAKMADVKREQMLMRDREEQFRDMSEAVNSRAMWWTVIQIIVLAVTCTWQMKHLATFFVKQKVV